MTEKLRHAASTDWTSETKKYIAENPKALEFREADKTELIKLDHCKHPFPIRKVSLKTIISRPQEQEMHEKSRIPRAKLVPHYVPLHAVH